MTALEKAARALAEADARGRANLYDNNPDLYTRLARTVLLAVREPGPEMLAAMNGAVVDHACLEPPERTDARLWTAGIDAILSEGQP